MNYVPEKIIPYGRQWISDEDIQAVVEVLKGDYLTTGPNIRTFEDELARQTNVKYAVAVSNGTTALHAACFAAGIGPGDEVITSPMTFAASANCILYMGAIPVFADIDPVTYNISPDEIRKKITKKTKAIIPVHFTGQPCDMDEILKIAEEHSLKVIWDGAHGLGAEYKGKNVATYKDMTTMSFHPVKHITTGEGGAILTDNKDMYEKLIMFRSHGITRDEDKLINNEGGWFYEQQFLGNNYRLTDISAALGTSQMKRLPMFLERRREIAKLYNEGFAKFRGLIIPEQSLESNSSWHLYVIQLDLSEIRVDRRKIFDELKENKIGVNVHYIPVYFHPYYKELGYKKGLCPNAEKLYNGIISLPIFPEISDEDITYVIEKTKEIIKSYWK